MPYAPVGFQFRSGTASVRESQSALGSIGHASDFTLQCNTRARGLSLVVLRWHFAPDVALAQHLPRRSTEHDVREFLRNLDGVARLDSYAARQSRATKRKNPGF